MNRREAKRLACWMTATVSEGARDGGWPFNGFDSSAIAAGVELEDLDGQPTADADRLGVALDEVIAEMTRRGQHPANKEHKPTEGDGNA